MRDASPEHRPAEPARGILREETAELRKQGRRVLPPESLSAFVHHVWCMRWSLTRPLVAEVLPYPTAQIVFRQRAGGLCAEVAGPRTARFTRRLCGEERVFGVSFRPGAFAPLFAGAMARLTDRALPLGEVFGEAGEAWARAIHAEPDFDTRVALAAAFLAPRLPALSVEVRRARDLVERMATDRSLLRVGDVCDAAGLDLRTLQREFRRYVGVSPKWALQRFRMLEAVERLKAPERPSLADLAASLEYADQAHFARDFKRVVGVTPRRFVERIRRGREALADAVTARCGPNA